MNERNKKADLPEIKAGNMYTLISDVVSADYQTIKNEEIDQLWDDIFSYWGCKK